MPPEFVHDAFISYSRVDKAFAARLEKALEDHSTSLTPDGVSRRLDVFRDEDDFTGTEYHRAIERHLTTSKALIVLCSPDARRSEFVDEEIRIFATAHGTERIIPVLVRGIPNNTAKTGEDERLAFPEALIERMRMPLAISYLDFDPARDKVNKGAFESSWFSLLANLLGTTRSVVEQRERQRQLRARNYWIAGFASVASVLLALSVWALVERNVAARQRDEALRSQSRFLAQASVQQSALGNHDLATKLALTALPRRLDQPDRPWVQEAESALRTAMTQQAFRFVLDGKRSGSAATPRQVRLSPDGARAVFDYGVQAELWDLDSGELLKTFRADSDSMDLSALAFSPDGRFLAIGYVVTMGRLVFLDPATGVSSVRGSLFDIVDARSGAPLERFQVDGHEQNHLLFSSDSKRLAIATDEHVSLADMATGQLLHDIVWKDAKLPPMHAKSWLRMSEDASRLAYVSADGALVVLDWKKGPRTVPNQGKGLIREMAFVDPRGDSMLVDDGLGIESVNLASNERARLPRSGDAVIVGMGVERHGALLRTITRDGRGMSWPMGEEHVDVDAHLADGRRLRAARFAPDGSVAFVVFEDGAVEHWNLANGERKQVLPSNPDSSLVDAGFASDGHIGLLATSDGKVRVWDRAIVASAGHQALALAQPATKVIFAPAGHLVAVGDGHGALSVRDPASGKVQWEAAAPSGAGIACLGFDSRGARLVSGSADGSAAIWDVASRGAVKPLQGHTASVDFCAFSPDGTLVVTGGRDSTFRLWNASSGATVSVLSLPREFRSLVHDASINAQARFTSDGKFLVTVTSGDMYAVGQPALVWDVRSGALLHALAHEGASIWDLELAADDRTVVTTSYDQTAALWDLASGNRLQTLAGNATPVVKAAFADRGNLLMTAAVGGVVRASRPANGGLVQEWTVGAQLFNMVASHDQRLLALGSDTSEHAAVVEFWDPVIPAKVFTLQVNDGALGAFDGLAFSPDDQWLLTRTQTGVVSLWKLPPSGQEMIDQAWGRVGRPGRSLLTHEQQVRFALAPS